MYYFKVYRLAEHTLPPGTTRCRDTLAGPIADTRKSQGAIPVMLFYWFWHPS